MEKKPLEIDLLALATLFLAIAFFALALVGIAVRGTDPWVVLPSLALGVYAILGLKKK